MKIGRNSPCPCGSGKKYKKCCSLKEQDELNPHSSQASHCKHTFKKTKKVTKSPITEQNTNNEITEYSLQLMDLENNSENDKISESITDESDVLSIPDNSDEPDEFDDKVLRVKTMSRIHDLLLKNKPHIKEYKNIRKLFEDICESMIDYYYKGNFTQEVYPNLTLPHEQEDGARKISFQLYESYFDLETDVGNSAFQDMLFFKTASNMNCIAEEFIKSNHFKKPEKVELLQCMLDSTLGLFRVTDMDSDEGYVYIEEVFTGNKFVMTDIALSSNMTCVNTYIYTRIITCRGVSFGTGLNFAFNKTDSYIKKFIKCHKKDYKPFGEFVRFLELYKRFSTDPKVKVVKNNFSSR